MASALWTEAELRPTDWPAMASGAGLWHAVDPIPPSRLPEDRTAVRTLAACGTPATVAPTYGGFDRSRDPERTCLDCVWTVAMGTGTEGAELAWLRLHHRPDVAAVAEAILAASGDSDDGNHEGDDPATVQLLVVVSGHAPVDLVDGLCAEQDCDHDPDQCPVTATACPTCSVRSGGWAGEREGTYLPACTIAGPCEVLRMLARHYRVPLPAPPAP